MESGVELSANDLVLNKLHHPKAIFVIFKNSVWLSYKLGSNSSYVQLVDALVRLLKIADVEVKR
jgi:hypothetical protein